MSVIANELGLNDPPHKVLNLEKHFSAISQSIGAFLLDCCIGFLVNLAAHGDNILKAI